MSGTAQQIVETAFNSLQHMPNGVENPIEGVAAVIAAGVGFNIYRGRFERSDEKYFADAADPANLEQSLESVQSLKTKVDGIDQIKSDYVGRKESYYKPMAAFMAGVALMGAGLFGRPTYSTNRINNEAHVAVVEDVTDSMAYTRDLGRINGKQLTRDQAVNQGIKDANYDGNLAVIQVGANSSVRNSIPMSQNWRSHTSALNKIVVNENSSDQQLIMPALSTAEGELPLAGKGNNTSFHEGTIDLISDGTIDDTNSSVVAEAKQLARDGVKVNVVIPGKGTASFNLQGGHYTSGVETANLPGFKNYQQPETAKAVINDVKDSINDAGREQHNQPWTILEDIGGVLLIGGLGKILARVSGRK
jgi:hypothetical protein